jgi:hypothetical protein
MVQEQEAIVKEAMKRDTTDIDLDENTSLDTKSKLNEDDDTLNASEFENTGKKNDITSTTKGNIEQILDAVPPSDRKKLVDNVSGMKTQIMGVIDSVIETMPKSSHHVNDEDEIVVGSYDGDDTYTFNDNTTIGDESVTGEKSKNLRLKVFSP